jgi:protein-S-isoprenylcysteine O-methyltransferase Ste14
MTTTANSSTSPLPPSPHFKAPTLTERYRILVSGRTRIGAAWIAALAIGFFAKQLPTLPGIVICFLGATLRTWASGYLRKDTRPAVGGPYAWVRNPLYLGTYLMAVGVLLAIESWIPLAVVSVVFGAIYHFIIFDEEVKLKRIFGEPYLLYLNSVPRFFPRPWKPAKAVLLQINPEENHLKYDWALSRKNKWYEAYATFFALMAWVSLAAWAWTHWRT